MPESDTQQFGQHYEVVDCAKCFFVSQTTPCQCNYNSRCLVGCNHKGK